MKHGTLLGSCDGSVISKNRQSWGGHSFSLQDWNTDHNSISGYCPTPMTNNITSLTPELYGPIATTIIVYTLVKHHDIEENYSTTIVIVADNKQAIQMTEQCSSPINISETMKAEYDLQSLLHLILKEIPITITYKWIKGHQDQLSTGEKIYGPFTRPVQTNIHMDGLAKLAASKSPDAKLIRPIYCTTVMGAYNEKNILIADIHKHILLASTYKELYKYLQKNINGQIHR